MSAINRSAVIPGHIHAQVISAVEFIVSNGARAKQAITILIHIFKTINFASQSGLKYSFVKILNFVENFFTLVFCHKIARNHARRRVEVFFISSISPAVRHTGYCDFFTRLRIRTAADLNCFLDLESRLDPRHSAAGLESQGCLLYTSPSPRD